MAKKWLDRTLIAGPYLALCTTEKDFKKALKHLGREDYKHSWVGPSAKASTHFFRADGEAPACIVCAPILKEADGYDSRLIHEAVHVWQEYRDWVGEESPGQEIEAYAIQQIATVLIEAYFAAKDKKRKKRKS